MTCPVTTLSAAGTVGSSTTCTAVYTVTAADLNAGSIVNTATVSGTPPTGAPVTSQPSTATVTSTQSPALTVVKTANPTTVTAIGQSIGYTFVVTNTGNVTLTGVAVADVFTAPAGPAITPVCASTTLTAAGTAGSSTTCTADYVTTAADFDAGTVRNSATASGLPPAVGAPRVTSQPSTAEVTATPSPSISVLKSASPTTIAAIGNPVSYQFVVTNTGNVTLHGISVADTLTAPAGPRAGHHLPGHHARRAGAAR